jgi:NTP pyrophosphatase (non-canonical NTP hydrolase)
MLTVSELGEAMEGHRKGLQDDHLPEFKMVEVELADTMIRICDLAGAKGYRLAEAMAAKMQYNAERADHKPENRLKAGGKKY